MAALSVDPSDPAGAAVLGYTSLRPPRIWTVALVFVVALLAGLALGGIIPMMMVLAQKGERFQTAEELRDGLLSAVQQPTILLTSGAATQLALLITALSAAILSPIPVVRRLRLNPSTLSPLGYVIAPVGAFAISILFGSIVTLLGIHETGTLKLLSDAFRHLTPVQVVFAVLVVGIMPGFAEEFLFRGYIQTRLVRRWGRWVGIGITALLFGVMHMDLLQGSFAMGFGIYIGYLVEKSGSIRPSMVCHALNNAVQVILGRYAGGGGGGGGEPPSMRTAVLMALITAAVVALCSLYIWLRVRPPAERQAGFPVAHPAELALGVPTPSHL